MTYEEKRQRNDAIFRDWFEAKIRGEKGYIERLAAKYGVEPVTIHRARKESQKRNNITLTIRPLC